MSGISQGEIPEDNHGLDSQAVQILALGKQVVDGQTRIGDVENRNRRLIYGLAISVFLDIVLSAIAIFGVVQAENASAATRVSCISSNKARDTERTLWNHVLDLSGQQSRTPQQQQQAADFKAFLNTNLADRRC